MKTAWTIPAEDPGDPDREIALSAALGPLMLELRGVDGFASAAEARRLAIALNNAADELECYRPIDGPEVIA